MESAIGGSEAHGWFQSGLRLRTNSCSPHGRQLPLLLQEGREPDYSEYKEFKLTVENIGYQMLMKMGWKEGEGLGTEGQGIKNPVNK